MDRIGFGASLRVPKITEFSKSSKIIKNNKEKFLQQFKKITPKVSKN
jgi:hypothetical protein